MAALRSERKSSSSSRLPDHRSPHASRTSSVLSNVLPALRRTEPTPDETPALHKSVLVTLKFSSLSFLDSEVKDDASRDPLYVIRTAGTSTRVMRNNPWDGLTETAQIIWPLAIPTKGKVKETMSVLVQMNDGRWQTGDTILKPGTMLRFNIPNFPHSMKWKRVGSAYWCTTTSVKGPVATFHPAVEGVPPRIKVYKTLHDKHDSRPILLQNGVSVLLIDHLIITAMLLVTDVQDWMLVQKYEGQESTVPILPPLASTSTDLFDTPPQSALASASQWRKILYGEPIFPTRHPNSWSTPTTDLTAPISTSSKQVAKILYSDPIYPSLASSPVTSNWESDDDDDDENIEDDEEGEYRAQQDSANSSANSSLPSPPMPATPRAESPSSESIFYPSGRPPSHGYIDPSYYGEDVPAVPQIPAQYAFSVSSMSREGVVRPRPPSYAMRYTRGMHDAPSTTGSENHVSAGSFEEELLTDRHSLEPAINGTSEHGDRNLLDLHDDGKGPDSGVQHREPEPKDSPSLPETTRVPSPIPSTGSSPRSPSSQPAVVQVFQQRSVSPGSPFSLPEKRSPIHKADPDIRSGSQDSFLEDPSKSGSSSSGSHSVTPSTSPEPPVVTVPTCPRPLPQLPSQRPQEWAAERTDAYDERRPVDRTLSATESESNVSTESSEDPAFWQTESYINSLLASWERRHFLLSMTTLPVADRRELSADQVRRRLGDVEAQIDALLICVIGSREARRAARRLESDRAQSFVDAIQDALHRGTLPASSSRSKARRLMQKVSEAGEQLPSSLFITGVNDHDEQPTFGGGFGDIYQASYQGRRVALKRIRTFTADSTTHRNRLRFYKEALVWQSLQHRFILPLLGIDRLTFAPSFCMVSPWMKRGTVLKYLQSHGRGGVNRLLLETAQGLDYLHSMDVVHGDLRGNNILITDEGNACLSDFGLATTIVDADSTVGVTSSSNRAGSVRWFAPELIEPTNFGCKKFMRTKASDVYAYACLYTGDPPFSQLQDVAAMLRVIRGERPEQPPSISAAVWQLMTSAWVEDFRGRPTIHDIALALEGIP
ncbi:hypothetical protein MSAN_02319200 [Mycena sanguinolenta]|uniref:Protein kinase domain-containing protein n=1 Tax=Mycena sanguinolenta TaxID=230812 RepID=A0A8H7CFS5_9AGAR|nr:hypothetical protein MSAN_02319200 [Mycena sanguinolenta]